jgi:hypothetical protein
MSNQSEELNIRFFGVPEEAVVEAEVLAKSLQSLQRAVYILAMDHSNLDPSTSNYVPQNIQKNFPVRCLLPQKGSYALPLQIGNPADLTVPEAANHIANRLEACLQGLVSGDSKPYLEQVRNGRYRLRLLDVFRGMLPKPGAIWKMGVSRPNTEEIVLTGEYAQSVSLLKEQLRQTKIVSQTITGYLQAMDFEAHKITILYPENNRELECFYDEELETDLLETRRDLVQVTGTVVVDDHGIPQKIQAVTNIQPLDLSDFIISEIACGECLLQFREPLTLSPEPTETKQYLILRHDDLDIDVIALTREELLNELHEQIDVLWREYAKEEDARLTPAALVLKRRLLDAIQEVPRHE